MLKCACKQHTFKQLLLIHNELCTLSSISWNPSSASSGHHIAPSCDVTKLYIVLVIPLKSLIGKKGRSIGRIKSLTCETSTNATNYKNVQAVVRNHAVPKHPITMSSLFSSTLAKHGKASASMISNHLTVAYYSDTFHHVRTSQRCFASEKTSLPCENLKCQPLKMPVTNCLK